MSDVVVDVLLFLLLLVSQYNRGVSSTIVASWVQVRSGNETLCVMYVRTCLRMCVCVCMYICICKNPPSHHLTLFTLKHLSCSFTCYYYYCYNNNQDDDEAIRNVFLMVTWETKRREEVAKGTLIQDALMSVLLFHHWKTSLCVTHEPKREWMPSLSLLVVLRSYSFSV